MKNSAVLLLVIGGVLSLGFIGISSPQLNGEAIEYQTTSIPLGPMITSEKLIDLSKSGPKHWASKMEEFGLKACKGKQCEKDQISYTKEIKKADGDSREDVTALNVSTKWSKSANRFSLFYYVGSGKEAEVNKLKVQFQRLKTRLFASKAGKGTVDFGDGEKMASKFIVKLEGQNYTIYVYQKDEKYTKKHAYESERAVVVEW